MTVYFQDLHPSNSDQFDDELKHNLIYISVYGQGLSKIPLISGTQWYLIYLNFYILVKAGSIYLFSSELQ